MATTIPALREEWFALISKYTEDHTLQTSLWREIERCYTKPKRHYHNLNHLQNMVLKAKEFNASIEDPDTLLFSIFYHDIVYNPLRKDNEEKSAAFAKKRLQAIGMEPHRIEKTVNQILATKTHPETEDNDTRYLLDFDLAILGEPIEVYKQYVSNIRKEYRFYPDFLYKPGRKNVLNHFLALKQIYKTPVFRQRYEAQARENLRWEQEQ